MSYATVSVISQLRAVFVQAGLICSRKIFLTDPITALDGFKGKIEAETF